MFGTIGNSPYDPTNIEKECYILDSQRIPITAKDRVPGPYPYYGANGVQDYVADYIFDDDLVLIAEDGGYFNEVGRVAYAVSGKCWVNNHAHILKPKEGLNLFYLLYCLNSIDFSTKVTGSTRQKLTQAILRKIEFPLPPIELQDQFSDFVKQVDKSKLVFREMVSKLDELVKSRFIEMFGNIDTNSSEGQTRLEYIGKFVTGGTPSSKHPEYYDGNIPWISSTALGPNYIDSSVAKYNITYEAIQNSSTVLIPPYSLIVGTRINVGGTSVNTDALCTCQDVVSVVNIPSDYNPLFLKFCIDYYKPHLNSLKRGATIKGINISDLKKLLIPSIPIGTQNAFVHFVKQVDKLKSEILEGVKKLRIPQ